MEPVAAEEHDGVTLQNLGRASLQIIHDIKNQLNGLKLYATFLRKRMEKTEQPEDQQETIAKLIAGLDRAASDLSVLVQYGRPLELHRQRKVDLQKLMRGVVSNLSNGGNDEPSMASSEALSLVGDFDPTALTDALKTISAGAARASNPAAPLNITCRLSEDGGALIEWRGVNFESGDPFRSFRGSEGIRMSLAAKIIEAHGGRAEHEKNVLRVRLPLS